MDNIYFETILYNIVTTLLDINKGMIKSHACTKNNIDETLFDKIMNIIEKHDTSLNKHQFDYDLTPNERLYKDVFGESKFNIPLDINDSIAYALNTLDPECKTIIELRYYNNMTYKEIGEKIYLPEASVRHKIQTALRVLRKPEISNIIKYGLAHKTLTDHIRNIKTNQQHQQHYAKLQNRLQTINTTVNNENIQQLLLLQAEINTILDRYQSQGFYPIIDINTPIEKLNLTTRTYNALKRAHKNTLNDLIKLTPYDYSIIRGLGTKSKVEITTFLNKYGLVQGDKSY